MKRTRIAVIFGGKSAEHNISLRSANNLISAIDHTLFEVYQIGITKEGHWMYRADNRMLLVEEHSTQPRMNQGGVQVCLPPACKGRLVGVEAPLKDDIIFDVVFPMLHGPFGEDGAIQGILKTAEVPFVGPDVLGAAVGMDKDVMKSLLRNAGIPIGEYRTYRRSDNLPDFPELTQSLGSPVYVKPANMGSSVGISKVRSEAEWQEALSEAFRYDNKIVVEQNIEGKELECSVLGNADPQASVVGEVNMDADFYDYKTKYLDPKKSEAFIPARISEDSMQRVREMAVKTYKVLQCEGLGRVDVFLTSEGKVFVNEINTLPGFTSISMYPKLWEHSGLATSRLIHKLVEYAIERFDRQKEILDASRTLNLS